MPDTFQNRLKQALEIREMKPSELAELSGLSKSRISQWVNGKFKPMGDGLYKIAGILHVSESWLMGNDVPMEVDRQTLQKKYEACKLIEQCYGSKAYELIEQFAKLDEADQDKVKYGVELLLADEKYSIKKESKKA